MRLNEHTQLVDNLSLLTIDEDDENLTMLLVRYLDSGMTIGDNIDKRCTIQEILDEILKEAGLVTVMAGVVAYAA